MKKVLIINGHPDKESFCFALAENYKKERIPLVPIVNWFI
jgi:hypothetical protein